MRRPREAVTLVADPLDPNSRGGAADLISMRKVHRHTRERSASRHKTRRRAINFKSPSQLPVGQLGAFLFSRLFAHRSVSRSRARACVYACFLSRAICALAGLSVYAFVLYVSSFSNFFFSPSPERLCFKRCYKFNVSTFIVLNIFMVLMSL